MRASVYRVLVQYCRLISQKSKLVRTEALYGTMMYSWRDGSSHYPIRASIKRYNYGMIVSPLFYKSIRADGCNASPWN